MNNKILIIGQAPPAKPQDIPYDSTLLYAWLQEVGVSKDQAQKMFHFEAISPTLRGVNKGAHMLPLKAEKEAHFKSVILPLMKECNKVILLGNVAKEFIETKTTLNKNFLCLLHPSRRNYSRYIAIKETLLLELKQFINESPCL